jgi:hypothetical protein
MSTGKALLIGCGGFLLLTLVGLAAFVGFIWYAAQDAQGVAVSIESPLDVRVGEAFDLIVKIKNERKDAAFKLTDIDFATDYIESFTVLSTDPPAKSTQRVPLIDQMSFTFGADVSAGTEKRFIFSLRAEKPGIHRGDVDVYEGLRFVTVLAQTIVSERPVDSPTGDTDTP